MKKLLLVLALGLGFTSTSHASLLVEPYLGYETGKGTQTTNDFTISGSNLGLRLGYASPVMVWFALDYQLGVSGQVNNDASGKDDYKRTTLGAVVGVDLPILFRAWIGYGFTNEIKLDTANTTLKGKNTKLGVGFTGLPFVSLNLEVISDKFDDSSAGVDPDTKDTTYMLSVSLPFKF